MDDQVQGVVERRDGGDDPDRLDDRERSPIGARRFQAHWNFAAGHDAQFVDGIAHAVDRAVDLDECIGKRLAALTRDLAAEMLALALHQPSQPAENLDPPIGFQPRVTVGEEPSGGLYLAVERRRVVAVEPRDRRLIECLDDFDQMALRSLRRGRAASVCLRRPSSLRQG
jgi:hypothetical protein